MKPDGRSRAGREWRKAYQKDFLRYFQDLLHCHDHLLSPEERKAFNEWAASFDDVPYPGDSAWPGWRKYGLVAPWERARQ